MKISLTNLSRTEETALTLAGSIGLLTERNHNTDLYFRREKALVGETHHVKHVNPWKGGKPCREIACGF